MNRRTDPWREAGCEMLVERREVDPDRHSGQSGKGRAGGPVETDGRDESPGAKHMRETERHPETERGRNRKRGTERKKRD